MDKIVEILREWEEVIRLHDQGVLYDIALSSAEQIAAEIRDSQWVSVGEPPTKTDQYIVALRVGSMDAKTIVTMMRYQITPNNSKWLEGDWQKVLAWQEKPEPPKD